MKNIKNLLYNKPESHNKVVEIGLKQLGIVPEIICCRISRLEVQAGSNK